MGYTNFPHGITSFGAPIHGTSIGVPIFGTTYFVDGTNGLDGNTGLEPDRAFKTIQYAVTYQIANTTGLGDVIYILPGVYAESVYAAALTNVKIIGVGADLVSIEPTDGHALQIGADGTTDGTPMENVTLRGISFHSASSTNTEYAAVNAVQMHYSVIEDCKFLGGSASTYLESTNATIGLQIGDRTGAFGATYELNRSNRISRCLFSTAAGRTDEFTVGISVGDVDETTLNYRALTQTIIEDCVMFVYHVGINLICGVSNMGGTVIRRNVITSNQGGGGPIFGIRTTGADDLLALVIDNRICALTNCILNFKESNVQGNIIATAGETPTWDKANDST